MQSDLLKIRHKLLNTAIFYGVFLVYPVVLSSISRALSIGWRDIFFYHIGIALAVTFLYLFRNKLRIKTKAHIYALIYGSINFMGGICFGVISGVAYFILTAMVVVLILDKKTAIIYATSMVLLYGILTSLFSQKYFVVNIDLNLYNSLPSSWIMTLIGLVYIFIVLINTVGEYNKFFITNIESLNKKISELDLTQLELIKAKEQAEEKEQQLRQISDNFENGMIYQVVTEDENTRKFTYLSESVQKYYGCTAEAAMLDPGLIYNRIYEGDREFLASLEKDAIRQMDMFRAKVRSYKPDGTLRWSYIVSKPRKNGKGIIWDGLEFDITDIKQTEEALLKSENLFRSLFNNMTSGLVLFEVINDDNGKAYDFRVLQANPEYEKQTKLDRYKEPGKTSAQFISQFPKDLLDRFFEVAHTGNTFQYERYNPELNRYFEVRVFSPIHGLFALLFNDITERKESEMKIQQMLDRLEENNYQLKLSEAKFQAVFENSKDAIGVSKAGVSVFCNKAYLDMFGYQSVDEMAGRSLLENIAPKEHDKIKEIIKKRTVGHNAPLNYETIGLRKNGEEFPFEINIGNYILNNEIYSVGIIRDITERKLTEEKIRLSEEKFYKSFNNNSVSMTISRLDNAQYIEVNEEFLKLTEWNKDEVIGYTVADLNLWMNIDLRKKMVDELKQKGSLQNYEIEIQTKTGNQKTILVSINSILVQNLDCLLVSAVEITRLKKAEMALRENEERLKYLLQSITDFIYSVKIKNGVATETLYGEGCWTVTGYHISDFKSNRNLWIDIVYPEDRPFVLKQAANIINKQIAEPLEHRIINKNGDIKWVRNTPVLKQNAMNELAGYDGLITDITERKIIEEALRTSEELYRLVTTNSGYMVYSYNPDDDSVEWNGDVQNVTEYTAQEYASFGYKEWLDMLHPDYKEKTEQLFRDAISSNKQYKAEYLYKVKSGHYIWVDAIGFKLKSKNNSGYKVIGIMKDISLQKKLEQQILTGVIETEERERLNFSQELHDGLGPLISAIKMYIQLLSMPDSKMDTQTIVNKAENLTNEATKVVREISFKLSPHILQNYGIVEALSAYIEKIRELKKIEVFLNYSNLCRFPDITETIIYRVVCECINNTMKHAKASKIDIQLECLNNILEINYADNGKGFDVDSVLNSRKGIGLLNMQSRIKSINGSFVIDSKPEIGTAINIKVKI